MNSLIKAFEEAISEAEERVLIPKQEALQLLALLKGVENWQLVPKLLTPAMHTAIVRSAGDQTYISWPANCWEQALEVAPKYEHK